MKNLFEVVGATIVKQALKWICIVISLSMLCGIIYLGLKERSESNELLNELNHNIDSLKNENINILSYADSLQNENDTLLIKVNERKPQIVIIKKVNDSLRNKSDSSYNSFIVQPDIDNCKNALNDCKIFNDSLAIYKDSVKSLNEKPLMNEDYFIKIYKYETILKYYNIIKRKPSQEKYFKGWVYRVIEE